MKKLTILICLIIMTTIFVGYKPLDNNLNNSNKIGIYTLENTAGHKIIVTNYGARVMEFWVPDKHGDLTDIVLGYDSVEEYLDGPETYFGAVIGRFGNRIKEGVFELDGETFHLNKKEGVHILHGGPGGFHQVIWDVLEVDDSSIVFGYLSEDGEEGFPGNLDVKMKYALSNAGDFRISYEAKSDRKTVINLTHHSFFNLNGAGSGDILDHSLQILANGYTPVDESLIPDGNIAEVKGSAFDFTQSKPIGQDIGRDDLQLKFTGGYGHNWVLEKTKPGSLELAAVAYSEATGIKMEVYTTEPGMQFYSGNYLDGSIQGKGGKSYGHRGAFCLETQHFPDSPNQPNFPSTTLNPGDSYSHECIYKLTILENS